MAAEFDPPFALFQFHAFQLVVGMESDLNAEIACYGFKIRDGFGVVCHNALPGEYTREHRAPLTRADERRRYS